MRAYIALSLIVATPLAAEYVAPTIGPREHQEHIDKGKELYTTMVQQIDAVLDIQLSRAAGRGLGENPYTAAVSEERAKAHELLNDGDVEEAADAFTRAGRAAEDAWALARLDSFIRTTKASHLAGLDGESKDLLDDATDLVDVVKDCDEDELEKARTKQQEALKILLPVFEKLTDPFSPKAEFQVRTIDDHRAAVFAMEAVDLALSALPKDRYAKPTQEQENVNELLQVMWTRKEHLRKELESPPASVRHLLDLEKAAAAVPGK